MRLLWKYFHNMNMICFVNLRLQFKASGRRKEYRGYRYMTLSRNQLKWIAIWTMVIDHIGYMFVSQHRMPVLYFLLRGIGRLSFPLICFLLVEGFQYTHSRGRYLARLWCFALISEIPYDLAFSAVGADWSRQNVFFTLGTGLTVLWGLEAAGRRWKGARRYVADILPVLAGMGAALLLRCDYSMWGVLMIVAFYVCRYDFGTLLRVFPLICLCQSWLETAAVLALPAVRLYSPRKQEGVTRLPKGFFYWFYPVHLLVLWGIKLLCVYGIGRR